MVAGRWFYGGRVFQVSDIRCTTKREAVSHIDSWNHMILEFSGPMAWRDSVKPLKPVRKERLRDLRPGDLVIYQGRQETIQAVEVYR